MKKVLSLILMGLAYLATFVLGSCTGLIHPACYAYVGALLPLLFAMIYLNTCSKLIGFGAATILNGFLLLVLVLAGEADIALIIGLVVLTALAEVIRYFTGYHTLKGVRRSFLPFAFSFFAYTAHWWTDTEGSLAAAVEEMREGYDQQMIPVIDNIPVLAVVLVLTVPIALWAMRLAERTLKKPAAVLK